MKHSVRVVGAIAGACLLSASCAATTPTAPPVAASSPSVTISAAATPRPGAEGSVCGKLVDYASSPNLVLTLEVRLATQGSNIWGYRLTGRGTAPSDLGVQFANGTPQVLYITGWFAPATTSPRQGDVVGDIADYSIIRINEACPTTN